MGKVTIIANALKDKILKARILQGNVYGFLETFEIKTSIEKAICMFWDKILHGYNGLQYEV